MSAWPATFTSAALAAQFLLDFPEFDTSEVTDPSAVQISPSSINYWANLALVMLNQSRWTADGDPAMTCYTMGLEMFIAHHVSLEALAQRDMQVGGIPGIATGVVAGKGAGDVSISYMPGATIEMDAGHWNYTVFGQRFIRVAKMIGSGPLQIGIGCGGPGWGSGGGGWSGPPYPWMY